MSPHSHNVGPYTSSYRRQPHSNHRPIPRPVPAGHKGVSARPVLRHPKPTQPQTPRQRQGQSTSALTQPLLKEKKPGGYVLAGGSMMLALMAVLLPHPTKSPPAKANMCQQQVQPQSMLSRDELTQLLSVPERSSKDAVRQVIAEPFCTMASVEVREGVSAEREAYPLEFDPQTWLVVLYEGNEYAGYDFSFQR
ncbi:MAG TPA: hypothetical protein V6D29_18075 [Leptolyngbyaceae cyanobacterium]